MIKVEVKKDSICWTGKRLVTLALEYPRFIHADFMTHRVFSRNASSSRATPVENILRKIVQDDMHPMWTINQRGMQGKPLTSHTDIIRANEEWETIRTETMQSAKKLADIGIHKQHANRILEPYQNIRVLLTATEWDNFFTLRNHSDAQPEIQILASRIKSAIEESEPVFLQPGEWHIPYDYNDQGLSLHYSLQDRLKISTARCARISYYNFNGVVSTPADDISLYHKLITSAPLHASPAEHQARVPTIEEYLNGNFDIRNTITYNEDGSRGLSTFRGKYFSNLEGWIQYRKLLEENVEEWV